MQPKLFPSCLIVLIFLSLVGCGDSGPVLVPVTGKVYLDDKPLPQAEVQFSPQGFGSPSFGFTDANGEYELQYSLDKDGAMTGEHIVRFMVETEITNADDTGVMRRPQLPARYNDESEIIREVTEDGDNYFEFKLESD